MGDLYLALKIMGIGILSVFCIMMCISVAIWLMGRTFVFFENRAERRRHEEKVVVSRGRKPVQVARKMAGENAQ